MISSRLTQLCSRPARGRRLAGFIVSSLLLVAIGGSGAETIVLHLKNGDQLTGTLQSEDTNRVVIATSWAGPVAVPLSQIQRREAVGTNAAPLLAQPVPSPKVATNMPPLDSGAPLAVVTVPSPPNATPARHWTGEARVGAAFLYGATDQQMFNGRFKLSYQRPYRTAPKEYLRNIFDVSLDYGWTRTPSTDQNVLSANRVDASDKTDIDVGSRFFLYNLAGVGYDEIRKINLRYEIGPGVGYHLFAQTNFLVNTELGFDFQAQDRQDDVDTSNFYYRLAQDITWRINHRLSLTEKFEFFPQVDAPEYRSRFESTVSYGLFQNLSLNLTVLHLYDTKPAQDVPNSDLQVRSSVGVKF